jgi:hypothetical protein
MPMPDLKYKATALNGKVYWLAEQQPSDGEGLCDGCAFESRTCMNEMPDDACSHDYARGVWKEVDSSVVYSGETSQS